MATARDSEVQFGTDGVRAVANRGPLRPEQVVRIGRVVGALLAAEPKRFHNPLANRLSGSLRCAPESSRSRTVLVGRDTRASGDMIAAALSAGLTSAGWDVVDLGVLPTPALAHLARARGVRLGAMITASHNSFEDNGIKLISPEGLKLPDEAERRIEAACATEEWAAAPRPVGAAIGRIARDEARVEGYVAGLVRRFGRRGGLGGVRVVLDVAHGAASAAAPEVFRRLGAEVRVLHDAPDGTNINRRCGALHPQVLSRAVRRLRAHAGFAFDGDGDRAMAVDETGAVLDGDHVLAIVGRHLAERRRLPGRTVVSTVMGNLGLRFALDEAGIALVCTPVGDRWVLERMLRDGFVLGGEQSGHVIFLDDATTGDGIRTALRLLEVARAAGEPLGRLARVLRKFPQVLVNVRVREKPPLEGIPEVAAAVATAERALGGRGRVLLRYSGTEPLARVMIEGEDARVIRAMANAVAGAVAGSIGE